MKEPEYDKNQEELEGPLSPYGIHIKKWTVTKALGIGLILVAFVDARLVPYVLAVLIISAVRTW